MVARDSGGWLGADEGRLDWEEEPPKKSRGPPPDFVLPVFPPDES